MSPSADTNGSGHTRIHYYPGCSLTSSAREMGESFFEIARACSLKVVTLEDWNCCGSTPAHSTNRDYGLLLPARNLILAESQGVDELMTLCPSCFVRLWDARRAILEDEGKGRLVKDSLGRRLEGRVRPKFFLDVLYAVGLERFKSLVKSPLKGIKGALYYGCLLSRQEWITGFDVEPQRGFLEALVRSLGAEPIHWSLERQCCGASLAVTKPEMSDQMVDRIRGHARRAGANCLVVFCPLCHMNLELRGSEVEPLPVLYITELIGLAAQLPHCRHWLGKHLVDARSLLST
jgi:heterodisulfide reductase subunit B